MIMVRIFHISYVLYINIYMSVLLQLIECLANMQGNTLKGCEANDKKISVSLMRPDSFNQKSKMTNKKQLGAEVLDYEIPSAACSRFLFSSTSICFDLFCVFQNYILVNSRQTLKHGIWYSAALLYGRIYQRYEINFSVAIY